MSGDVINLFRVNTIKISVDLMTDMEWDEANK